MDSKIKKCLFIIRMIVLLGSVSSFTRCVCIHTEIYINLRKDFATKIAFFSSREHRGSFLEMFVSVKVKSIESQPTLQINIACEAHLFQINFY